MHKMLRIREIQNLRARVPRGLKAEIGGKMIRVGAPIEPTTLTPSERMRSRAALRSEPRKAL